MWDRLVAPRDLAEHLHEGKFQELQLNTQIQSQFSLSVKRLLKGVYRTSPLPLILP